LNHEFALKVLEFDNIKIRYFYEEYPSWFCSQSVI
jgi:hypothetical protein